MATYNAYKIVAHTGEVIALVWWDKKTIRSDSPSVLNTLKDSYPDGAKFSDGEAFFKKIPNIYKSGYLYTDTTQVNEEGKEV